jgi:hypothetical protein
MSTPPAVAKYVADRVSIVEAPLELECAECGLVIRRASTAGRTTSTGGSSTGTTAASTPARRSEGSNSPTPEIPSLSVARQQSNRKYPKRGEALRKSLTVRC